MGKKSAETPAPIIMPATPAPIIYEMKMPEMPAMPEIPVIPAPTYVPPDDYREQELQEENERRLNQRNRLRVGRTSTIATSALGDLDEPEILKQNLLGA